MTEPAFAITPRHLALAVVERCLRGSYLSPTLNDALDASSFSGADRSLVTDLSYGVVRRLLQLDAVLIPHLRKPEKLPPNVRNALRIGAYELLYRGTPAYAAVSAWVAVVKDSTPALAGLTNAVLRRVQPLPDDSPAALRASLPPFLFEEFGRALGDENASRAGAAMLEHGPLWLTALRPDAAELLQADGCEVQVEPSVTSESPASLRVRSPLPLKALTAYQRGAVQAQNPSSLRVALALGAGQGDEVYDLASGRGVKSAVLASLGVKVTAVEINPSRSLEAHSNLARLGLHVDHVSADLRQPLPLPARAYVLLDAPCSGSGTLRGNPEIKLRLTPQRIAELARLQLELLETASRLVAPGGVLVYSVCSLTLAEGPAVVEALLGARGDFTPETFPTRGATVNAGPGAYLLPLAGHDGFYLARLRRGV